MGRRRSRGRKIDGVLLLDKPAGMTSNGVLQRVKRLFNAQKAGHTGSLDPIATGLLPICLGEATKLSSYLLNADKSYLTRCKLGVKTASGDIEGDVIETRPVAAFTQTDIEKVLKEFTGEIEQIPPMHSAIKQGGQPLYKLAHQGLVVERESRRVTIHSIKLISFAGDALEIEVSCSKGTYIRTLVEDIGERLGTGAHVIALRRLNVGVFEIQNAVTLDALEETLADSGLSALDESLIPMETALADWPGVNLSEDAAFYLRQGQAVLVPRAPTEGLVRLFEPQGRFLGIGQVQDDGRIAPKRLVNLN